jgi:hypothetical protein
MIVAPKLFLVGQLKTDEREMWEASNFEWQPIDGDGTSDSEEMIEWAGSRVLPVSQQAG